MLQLYIFSDGLIISHFVELSIYALLGIRHRKMPETTAVSGILQVNGIDSALGELRCAAGGLQTVLLSVLRAKTVDFTGFFRFSRLG